jgi:hypothetical protein
MKRKRLNVTRQAGRLYFRRETRRLSDGTPDGEILWIMNSNKKPRKAVFCGTFLEPPLANAYRGQVWFHLSTYRIQPPISAARLIRNYLLNA